MNLSSGVYIVTVTTGGTGYASTPSVVFSGGGGAGAAASAVTAGNTTAGFYVQSIVVTHAGSGYASAPLVSFSGGGGTGAAADALIIPPASSNRPYCMFQGRNGDMYGVNGSPTGGFRWDGVVYEMEELGMRAPGLAPVITAATTPAQYYVDRVQMVRMGNGYHSVPSVQFVAGTTGASTQVQYARAVALLNNARVTECRLLQRGKGYSSQPEVQFTGGIAKSEAFTVNTLAKLAEVQLTAGGSGYTQAPTVSVATANGLTGAYVIAFLQDDRVAGIELMARGDGATGTVGLTITGGGGTGAQAVAFLEHRVTSVSVAHSGVDHFTPPVISIIPDPANPTTYDVARVTCSVTTGNIQAVTVLAAGGYAEKPTAKVIDTTAKAQASMARPIIGKYRCAIRYVDDTVPSRGGPIPSNISPLATVEVFSGANSFTWAWTNNFASPRAHRVEIWRTTADQSVVLYRVASLPRVNGVLPTSYSGDDLADFELLEPNRAWYGVMPIVLPSGQVNARRFGVPPRTMAVACMFQDRAWYSADTTGTTPNSLRFSEIDEPESCPPENELVLQENVAEPDRIVAMCPFGSSLLIIQERHTYKLQYVAQPVIDASIMLAAYRGVLHNRCWALMGGVCFLVDSYGMWAYDGSGEEAVSVPIDNYWRDRVIDFTKAQYFHVQADPSARVVRFFYCQSSDGVYPQRALCYCTATKAWWEETFAQPVTAGTVAGVGGKQTALFGTGSGAFVRSSGTTDASTGGATSAIAYRFRTHSAKVIDEPDRSIGILYKPTSTTSNLGLAVHYNNSTAPRANAISTDRGSGFTTVLGGTSAALDMRLSRSHLGDASGHAKAYYAGRLDDKSAGADRHIAVDLSGSQAGDSVAIYGLTVGGVT